MQGAGWAQGAGRRAQRAGRRAHARRAQGAGRTLPCPLPCPALPFALPCPLPCPALCPALPCPALCPALCPLPFALCPLPFALCPLPCALRPAPCALRPLPFALRPAPCALRPAPWSVSFTGHSWTLSGVKRVRRVVLWTRSRVSPRNSHLSRPSFRRAGSGSARTSVTSSSNACPGVSWEASR